MAGLDAEPVPEARVLRVEALPCILGFLAVNIEGAELLAVRAVLDPSGELERRGE